MTFAQKLRENFRCGKCTIVKNNINEFCIFSTPDLNGNLRGSDWSSSIEEARKYIGQSNGYINDARIDEIAKRDSWQIVGTIDFSELGGEGYKEGEKVRIFPDAKDRCEKRGLVCDTTMTRMINEGYGFIDGRSGSDWNIWQKDRIFSRIFPPSAIEPFYEDEKKVETIRIGESVYDKAEFELAVKDLKKINN